MVWQQVATWKLRQVRQVPTWLPEHQRLDLADAVSRFAELWKDPAWRGPLKLAVSWLVEANGSGAAPETRIVLAQVALELLAPRSVPGRRVTWGRRYESVAAAAHPFRPAP